MNPLTQKIAAAIDAHTDTSACVISADFENRHLTLHVATGGAVGLALDSLEYRLLDHPPLTKAELKGWADRLVAKLTYLMEPLVVLELDAEVGQAQLRSQSPSERQSMRTYYEIQVDRNASLRLARVTFDEATRKRSAATCQFTREAIERLANDLATSLD